MLLHISDDPAAEMALRFTEFASRGDTCTVAVSGGRTPATFYSLLAAEYRARIPWNALSFYQVDERCVSPSDPRSNWRMLLHELLAHVPPVKAFRMEAERERAAEDYEQLLRAKLLMNAAGMPVFDLVLLGMGADGHTASLFPGTHALGETQRLAVRNEAPQLEPPRITLTFPVLNAAKRKWFLVSGADKAPAFAEARRGHLPAGQIHGAEWFVGREVVQP